MYVIGGIGLLRLSLMNVRRWHEVMQCQHRIAKAKTLNGGFRGVNWEVDK